MSIDEMRDRIAKVYPGEKWKRKVANMYDDQVIAVYYKFAREGRFNPDYKKESDSGYGADAKQLSIFDLL